MTSVLMSILPSKRVDNEEDDYNSDYSFAMEYSGPPVSGDIPEVVPVDFRRIPTAAMVARASTFNNLSLPVIKPIVRSGYSEKKLSIDLKLGSESPVSDVHLGQIGGSDENLLGNSEDGVHREEALGLTTGESNVLDRGSSSSGGLGFSDGHADSNWLSGSSKIEDLDEEYKEDLGSGNCSNASKSTRSGELEDCEDEAPRQGNRIQVVTFRDYTSSEAASEEDDDGVGVFPERPVVVDDMRKGTCYRCHKRNRFGEKEVCIVCGAKYCSKCVLRAMGSMPQGRKCITCIDFRIDELRRGTLGKCSRMLRKLLTDDVVKQIMSSEVLCEVNQLPPHLIYVNDRPLSMDELVLLQSCPNPPKKLKPGKYWYDKVSGFWGKEGEKPCQIISPQLAVGNQIRQDASNGNTNVQINNREITKPELWMLQAAGIRCEGNPTFWVTADGSYQHEGMNNVMGKLWDKKIVKIACAALSLPFPSSTANPGGEGVDNDTDKINSKNIDEKATNKLLLVGSDQSGTSTIFKQAKILYNVPFSEDERENIKVMIQRNLYSYIGILLEGRERFEQDYLVEMRRQRIDQPSSSANTDQVDEKNIYSISPRLKGFSSWLLQIMVSGNLEAIFPAATREYAPLVEELWKDRAFQATYTRRNELHMLPRVANYFLNRGVEIARIDYEPSDMDILYAENITSSNGVASMDFSFPNSSYRDSYMEPAVDHNNSLIRYQLIRVHADSLGENCKWLEMFEDVDLVMYCVSLIDYDEFYEDINGVCTNKMLASKKLFTNIVTHPTFVEKDFLLILNKFDLLEEKIEHVPLTQCDWFQDFNPVTSLHPYNNNRNNTSLAQRAFHYIAAKYKRLFTSITGRKLFVIPVTGLEADSVDKALQYGREVLRWAEERHTITMTESTESMEPSTSL
ncbi:extra-large guanine nucleotide-binding protein 1-like [Olea europaea var. sylvestris]|uniref:extra-large guanine nucleotide-binding protein 1-like n=1 Tax=Olea europaea var. sylvestris TaxID=158386 RepID=UPI000C1D2A56|nr:extra-large guanine nucleotide-binding protein 1-like [Olea europaea var. sylvestris]